MGKPTLSCVKNNRDANSDNYGSRGSGRRQRQKFNHDKWLSSTPSRKTNVLCLGVSYPSVQQQLLKENISKQLQLLFPKPCVEQAIELVRRKILTEMDGRDLARCVSLESANQTNAYCASLESGAAYSQERHLCANFNRKGFTKECIQAFGHIKFRQIILDYFWIPKGSWAMTHWKPDFFQFTLPSFVKDNLLETSTICSFLSTKNSNINTSLLQEGGASGVVYLPFTLHVVARIVAAYKELSECYTISFMKKSELSEHALWYATSQINPESMQSYLGKAINQEDTYCTFSIAEVKQTSFRDVTKQEVLDIITAIDEFQEVRMIRLQALNNGESGGFVGLLNDLKQRRPPLKKLTITTTTTTTDKSQKQDKIRSDDLPSKAITKGRNIQFLVILMQLINDLSENKDNAVVVWQKEGKEFLIKNVEQFEKEILRHHFNGIKYETFVKYLMMRGFTKNGTSFFHTLFCRGKEELSLTIDERPSSTELKSRIMSKKKTCLKSDRNTTSSTEWGNARSSTETYSSENSSTKENIDVECSNSCIIQTTSNDKIDVSAKCELQDPKVLNNDHTTTKMNNRDHRSDKADVPIKVQEETSCCCQANSTKDGEKASFFMVGDKKENHEKMGSKRIRNSDHAANESDNNRNLSGAKRIAAVPSCSFATENTKRYRGEDVNGSQSQAYSSSERSPAVCNQNLLSYSTLTASFGNRGQCRKVNAAGGMTGTGAADVFVGQSSSPTRFYVHPGRDIEKYFYSNTSPTTRARMSKSTFVQIQNYIDRRLRQLYYQDYYNLFQSIEQYLAAVSDTTVYRDFINRETIAVNNHYIAAVDDMIATLSAEMEIERRNHFNCRLMQGIHSSRDLYASADSHAISDGYGCARYYNKTATQLCSPSFEYYNTSHEG